MVRMRVSYAEYKVDVDYFHCIYTRYLSQILINLVLISLIWNYISFLE